MFRYPYLVGPRRSLAATLQQRSWGCALRSFSPGPGWLNVSVDRTHLPFPERVHLDNFRRGTGRSENLKSAPTLKSTRRGHSHRGSWASFPWPVCCRAGFWAERQRYCRGLCLLQDCRTLFGAFTRARPRVDHQPPETASGSYPLMGFACSDWREMAAKQSPDFVVRHVVSQASRKTIATSTIRCGPSAY
jgi:hypothetical protein